MSSAVFKTNNMTSFNNAEVAVTEAKETRHGLLSAQTIGENYFLLSCGWPRVRFGQRARFRYWVPLYYNVPTGYEKNFRYSQPNKSSTFVETPISYRSLLVSAIIQQNLNRQLYHRVLHRATPVT